MKKRLPAILTILLPWLMLALAGCGAKTEGFAVYLTKDDVPVAQMEALSHVEIASTPVISDKDIIAYYKDTHEIELTVDAYQRVQSLEIPTNGRSFVVCVNKVPIYWGAFWTPVSSQSFNGVTIMLPSFSEKENTIQIGLGYPSPSFYQGEDPRSDPAITEALEKAGKLK
jgi:hypothetical protein